MSRYKPYSNYKDSEVAWLGEVPEHWSSVSLKWISKIYSGGTPDKTNLSYWDEGSIPWLASGEVNQFYITTPTTYITKEAYSKSSAKWISKDALVMALAGQGKTKGMVAQLGIETTCNQSMAAIVLSAKIHSRFILWWLNSNYENIRNLAGGDLRDGLNLELLGGIPCPFMELSEQIIIANFLDHETTKIDTLIAKQERMIELLGEKRSALISHAVTKGLDLHVKMKDSGVKWLGEVPEGWSRTRLGYIAEESSNSFVDGPFGSDLKSEEYMDEGIPLIQLNNIKEGEHILKNMKFISEEKKDQLARHVARPQDIVIAKMADPVARAAMVNEAYNEYVIVADCVRLTPDVTKIHLPYLIYSINSKKVRIGAEIVSTGTTRIRVNLTELKKLWIPYPPIIEQTAIADYLDTQTAKIDTLIAKARQAIELMKERRTALISAAVTGKIDVRGIV